MRSYVFFLGWTALAQAPQEDLNPDQIARANAAAVQSIRSVVVHVTQYMEGHMDSPGGVPKAKERKARYTWYWSGDDQRVLMQLPVAPSKGRPSSEELINRYNGAKGFKEAYNCDPSNPPVLSETDPGAAFGRYGPRSLSKSVFAGFPKVDLLWEVLEKQEPRTLADLVRTSKSVRVTKRPAQSALGCYELDIARGSFDFMIYVDPSANFMIRRIETQFEKSPDSKVRPRGFVEVDGFRDYRNGVFLPIGVHGEYNEIITVKTYADIEFKLVNQPLPTDAFDVTFVDWMRVTDMKTGQLHLWGPDNKPRRTFESKEKYREWYNPILAKKQAGEGVAASGSGRTFLVAAIVVSLAGIGLYRVWRKRQNQSMQ